MRSISSASLSDNSTLQEEGKAQESFEKEKETEELAPKKKGTVGGSTLKRIKVQYPIYAIPPEDVRTISSAELTKGRISPATTTRALDDLSSDWYTEEEHPKDDLEKITCKAMMDGIMIGRPVSPPDFTKNVVYSFER